MIIKTSQDEIQNYLTDAANVKGYCDAVYIPETTDEIPEILINANKDKIPVTISGNGTGLTGGRVPQGGIVISTEKLNKIIEINDEKMYAIVEPGVILSDLQAEVRNHNLLYPPDPTERNCFIGATIATNASGEKTFKYGPTRNFVLELEIILASGEKLKLVRGENIADEYSINLKTENESNYKFKIPDYIMPETKNTTGYFAKKNMDVIDLFIGSEGTLGVLTKAKLRLVPLPEKVISCVVFFDDEMNALKFIEKARYLSYASRVNNFPNVVDALALEFLDENSLKFLTDDNSNIPSNSKAAVWFEQEVIHDNEDILLEEWTELISKYHGDEESVWFAFSEADNKKIQEFRHSLGVKVNEYISKNNLRKLGTDAAVPDNHFFEFYNFAKDTVKKANLNFIVFGHAGNSHVHLNMLPKNEDELKKGKDVYKQICIKAVQLAGTVSAEHGIGKIKRDYLLDMYGIDNIKKMMAIKKALDPNWILGRGNIFSEELA